VVRVQHLVGLLRGEDTASCRMPALVRGPPVVTVATLMISTWPKIASEPGQRHVGIRVGSGGKTGGGPATATGELR